MLNINKIKFANIGRFVGEHEIDLTALPKLVQCDAQNKNTGGSSGSGKTTVFLALEYVFGINDAAATILQSRLTKSAMSVTVFGDNDGKPFEITRSKSDGLTIVDNGVPVSGSSKIAEEALDKLVAIPRKLLRPMLHKRQGEGGFFLSLTPKECHDFLMECLGQKELEQKILKAEKDSASASSFLAGKEIQLAEKRTSLGTLVANFEKLAEPQRTVNHSALDDLEAGLDVAKKDLLLIEADKTTQLSKLTPPAPVATEDDPTLVAAVSLIEGDITTVTKVLSDLEADENARKVAKQAELNGVQRQIQSVRSNIVALKSVVMGFDRLFKEGEEISKELTHLSEAKCPTCKQLIKNGSAEGIAAKLNARFDVVRAEMAKCKSARDEVPAAEALLPPLEEQVKQLNLEIIQQNAKISKCNTFLVAKRTALKDANAAVGAHRNAQQAGYQAAVAEYNANLKKVTAACDYAIYNARLLVSNIEQSIASHRAKQQSEDEAIKNYRQYNQMLAEQIANVKVLVDHLELEATELKSQALIAKEAARFVKSYSNQLFQDSLAVVAENATRILSRIPNMATASISFDSMRETQKGGLKEEVVAVLSVDNEVGIPVKSISGGEKASAHLAVDLGVIDMVEARTGKGINLFILDEPFDGLDAVCRENCLEVLKAHISGKRIVIVDHSNETKQMVPDKIVVVREGMHSSVRIE